VDQSDYAELRRCLHPAQHHWYPASATSGREWLTCSRRVPHTPTRDSFRARRTTTRCSPMTRPARRWRAASTNGLRPSAPATGWPARTGGVSLSVSRSLARVLILEARARLSQRPSRNGDAGERGVSASGSDGGVFAFGGAGFYGSLPEHHISVRNIVGIAPTADGRAIGSSVVTAESSASETPSSTGRARKRARHATT